MIVVLLQLDIIEDRAKSIWLGTIIDMKIDFFIYEILNEGLYLTISQKIVK